MKKDIYIDSILDNLVKSGSEISYLKELRDKSIEITTKDISLSETLNKIAEEIKNETEEFLNNKNEYNTNYISGISTCIYLPDFNRNGEYKLKLIGGSVSRDYKWSINDRTLFDIASITKVYTLLLAFKLEEKGILDLDKKVSEINPDFQNLEDFTLNDLIRLHGELRTNGNIKDANSREEAYQILKTLYLESNTREENKYTDFGAIVLSDTIEKVVSNYLNKSMTFEEVMEEYLLDKFFVIDTKFNPSRQIVSGNGNDLSIVHDPKARILGGAVGHAGLFTTSDDLARLAKEIYSVNYYNRGLISRKNLARLGEITFPNSLQSNKGNLGIYVKHPKGLEKTYTPAEFSTGSFSHQGWTGSVATFDPNNLIHNNILVNAIYEDSDKDKVRNDKPTGFTLAFEEYQRQITANIMLMYVAKQYYNKYCNEKENIDVTKYIK